MKMKTGYAVFKLIPVAAIIILLNACSKKSETPITGVTPPSTSDTSTTPTGTLISNITYGSAVNWQGQTQQLMLDVYKPNTARATKKPLILFIHGGGFLTGDKSSAASFAELMNQKGYIVAPIDYRLGWAKDEANPCNSDSLSAFEAYYRALQDTRAALRYLVAHADDYGIDTSWIFIGGASAGGITSLSIPYYNQENISSTFSNAVISKLGPLDADNDLKTTFSIKGVIAMWGALENPNVITPSNAVPTIFFHGTEDDVCPFGIGHFYNCNNMQVSYGTKPLYDRLISFGVPAVAHVEPGGGHGVYTEQFRVDNSACFIENLMNGTPETGYYLGDKYSCK